MNLQILKRIFGQNDTAGKKNANFVSI